MNKQQLAAKIWASANKMRSRIEANDYKDYILGFIFYKYLSDKEEAFLLANDWTRDDLPELNEAEEETVAFCRQHLGYFIAYDHLFSTWLSRGRDFDVSAVHDALSAFNRLISDAYKKLFEGIFDTLQTGLSRLGESAGAQTKAINGLIQLIRDIPTGNNQGYDVLGFIYEYLIGNFAANAGKKAGEFYTPHEVSVLMSEIVAHHLRERDTIKIYDPTSGSGSLLINIGRSVSKHIDNRDNIKYYAQELKENTYNLTRMNLIMRDILPNNVVVRNGDTLEDDWPYFDESDPVNSYNPLYVDAVVSNPPYSQAWNPEHKETDPRYARFGLAPRGKADYAFLLHDLYHVKPDGIMTIVLPHGVLFRGGEEEKIRTNLIEFNHIDAIIGLPPNVFFGTGIPTIVMVLRQQRQGNDLLIVDASRGFAKEGKNNRLRACDIKKIADTVIGRRDLPKFSRLVSRDEVRANGYNLNIPRYVDASDPAETRDIYATMFGGIPHAEIDSLSAYWQAFPALRGQLFADKQGPVVALADGDLKQNIADSAEVQAFLANCEAALSDFPAYLKAELIDACMTLNVAQQEARISRHLFAALAPLPLIDRYEAYQLLDDAWLPTAADLEVLQSEGWEAIRKVDPRLVMRKTANGEEEVQDGWTGRVIPFELLQKTLLRPQYDALKQTEHDIEALITDQASLADSLLEAEDNEELLKEESSDSTDSPADTKELDPARVTAKAKAVARTGQRYADNSLSGMLLRHYHQAEKLKRLKKERARQAEALEKLSIVTLEQLSDADAERLLVLKWISPLCDALGQLPGKALDSLATDLKRLDDKYANTYTAIDKELKEAGQSLAALIGELEGEPSAIEGLQALQALLTKDAL